MLHIKCGLLFQISTEAQGKSWSLETSAVKDYVPHTSSSNSLRANAGSSSSLRNSGAQGSSDDLESFYGISK